MVLNCPHCGKNLFWADKLARHLKINKCPRQYPCDNCDMAFRTSYDLIEHEKVTHEDP